MRLAGPGLPDTKVRATASSNLNPSHREKLWGMPAYAYCPPLKTNYFSFWKPGNRNEKMGNELFDFISKYITLTADEQRAIEDLDLFKSYKKGTVLLREGDVTDEYYFVVKGCLRTYYNVDGEEKTTALYTEAESVTPLCVTTRTPSDYNIACVEDSILAVATLAMEQEIFARFPRFESLCRMVSEELLAKNQSSFDTFKTASPEQRYLHLLNTRPDLIRRVPQHQLASFLGMTPQSLSRIRGRLAKQQVV